MYNYNYQVANDKEQVYISMEESRNGDAVQGQYSYVDANGSLVTVTYTADDVNGYQETREVQEGFLSINAQPQVTQVISQPAVTTTTVQTSQSDLVGQIISQLTPFIRDTVSTTLSSSRRPAVAVQPISFAPALPVQTIPASSVQNIFGQGGPSNIRVETPSYQFSTQL